MRLKRLDRKLTRLEKKIKALSDLEVSVNSVHYEYDGPDSAVIIIKFYVSEGEGSIGQEITVYIYSKNELEPNYLAGYLYASYVELERQEA